VILSLDKHEQQELTAPYGERHPGFSPRALRTLCSRAGLSVVVSEIACREPKKPHFKVALVIADRPRKG
jgi:ArsR family transcriptional regulator